MTQGLNTARQPRPIADGFDLLECLRWNGEELIFADVHRAAIRAVRPDGSAPRTVAELPAPEACGLVLLEGGALLAGSPSGRRVFHVAPNGQVETLHDLSDIAASNINEIILAPDGTLLVGCMGFDYGRREEPRAVPMIRVTPDGRQELFGPPLTFANGLAWEPGTGHLLVAETFGHRITRLRWDAGEVVGETFTDLSGRGHTHPDGLFADDRGRVWYADGVTGAVVALDRSGQQVAAVPTGYAHASSCVLMAGERPWLAVTVTGTFQPGAGSGALVAVPLPDDLC